MNPTTKPEPSVGRPHFPAGYVEAGKKQSLLPWTFVQEQMRQAKNYWIITADTQARPAATPVWGVWIDDRLYFDGSPQTRRGRNIAKNPQVTVHLESGDQAVILEGEALILSQAPERGLAARIAAAYGEKYTRFGYTPTPEQWDQGGLFIFSPHKVLAWTDFTQDPTRFLLKGTA